MKKCLEKERVSREAFSTPAGLMGQRIFGSGGVRNQVAVKDPVGCALILPGNSALGRVRGDGRELKRQVARFIPHIVKDAPDQPWFKFQLDFLRRLADRTFKLFAGHRTQVDLGIL